jgi:hypothetical protein
MKLHGRATGRGLRIQWLASSACILAFAMTTVASIRSFADTATQPTPPASATTSAPATTAPGAEPAAGVESIGSKTRIIINALAPVPNSKAAKTTISSSPIQHADPARTIPQIMAQYVPGASDNPDNGLRIRGADDQFTTYLDGAPIPESISGTITDVLDPRDIHTLDVYTGGFPAQFGGQLSGLFDITTNSGGSTPLEEVSQSAASEGTYVSSAVASGTAGTVGYFASASDRQTDFFLNPPTETVSHDFGMENHEFVKLNSTAGSNDSFIVQLGANGAQFEVPGSQDNQNETGDLANFIWNHAEGSASTRTVLYLHHSALTYTSGETLAEQETSGNLVANQNLNTTNVGLRTDQSWKAGSANSLMAGYDVENATADQDFTVGVPASSTAPAGTLSDNSTPHSWSVGLYAQDDWDSGRTNADYGVRYDEYSQDVTKSQVSPRVNLKYRLNRADTLHAYYDRLYQPIAVEDAVHLVGQSSIGDNGTVSPELPESDNLYEVGIDHNAKRYSVGVAAYYKTGVNVRDDDQVGNTNILLPVNDAKAYFRGVEFTSNSDLSKTTHAFANLSLSWNRNAGPVTGGLNEGALPTLYFYDDHDQTYTGIMGVSYSHRGSFADIDGEYGSGQPYGEIDNTAGIPIAVNYLRVPPHFIINIDGGNVTKGGFTATLFVDNLLNHGYVIKEITSLSNAQYAEGRVVGVRLSQDF